MRANKLELGVAFFFSVVIGSFIARALILTFRGL